MDKKYYYTDGQDKFGPYSVEELKLYNLTVDTLVWAEGMGDWTPAGKVPELKSLFPFDPPAVPDSSKDPFQTNTSGPPSSVFGGDAPMGPKPKNWLVESILVLIFCCWPFAIPAIIAATKVDSAYARGDYQGALDQSANAKKWVITSFTVGLVVSVLYFIILIATDGFR